MLGELGGQVAVVVRLQQRLDRRRLEQDVGLALGVHVIATEGLDVQGLDQPLVDRHRRTALVIGRSPATHSANSPWRGRRAYSAQRGTRE